jgi:hypothetical protein
LLHLTFDLELYDPIKKLDAKTKEKYFLEQEKILKEIFSKINNNNIKISCFVTNEFVDVYNDFFHRHLVKYHEIGCHTANHLFYDNNDLSKFIKNIKKNKKRLERESVLKCIGFRAPGGFVPKNLIEILKRNDFKYDSSIVPGIMIGRYNHLGCPKHPYYPSFDNIFRSNDSNKEIIEFPLLTSKFLNLSMNGIFFSIYGRFIKLTEYENSYAAIYFHPSDFKKFKFFEKSFIWDKIKFTKIYWKFLNEYIKIYANLDTRLKVCYHIEGT